MLRVVEETSLSYVLSTPPAGLPPEGGWPLLCFLHGYAEAAPLPIRAALAVHGPLAPESAPIGRAAFVAIAPQLPRCDERWAGHALAVQMTARHAETLHAINPRRRYLTGFSRGADGVFELAVTQPEWVALWAVDPPRVPPRDPGRPIWISAGSASRPSEPAFVERLQLEVLKGGTPGRRVYVDAGLDHVGTARCAYQDEGIYHWLLSYRAPGAPSP
jgi:predicted peptidase